eukprot:8873050-Alexandrium_andersonii.AAC.1
MGLLGSLLELGTHGIRNSERSELRPRGVQSSLNFREEHIGGVGALGDEAPALFERYDSSD